MYNNDLQLTDPTIDRLNEYVEESIEKHRISDDTLKQCMYTEIKVIGKGAFGSIILCEKTVNNAQQRCVLKVVKKKYDYAKEDTYMEIFLQTSLKHPQIVKCAGWYETETSYVLELEHIDGQDLFEVCRVKRLSREEILDCALQLLGIMVYLKVNNVIHRDIKPENIIVDSFGRLHLCDFGLATVVKSNAFRTTNARAVGTIDYMTPEMINYREYGFGTDMWAYGVLLYELVYRSPPFTKNNNSYGTMIAIQKMKVNFDEKRQELYFINDLLKNIFVEDIRRIRIENCINHPYFTS
ncbi:putative Auroralike protein kinase [Yasminevirus sp. GU-2018]|uniref:Putative Auroralike protein kinase n=1 Tax=Yasminevirus sp. GU-2018 TaxID=2420051 RepID=A0A5K0U7L0_9VIRU|nr:putative Auroralike protein kinase [Yasminevirus sp. GU-2018]